MPTWKEESTFKVGNDLNYVSGPKENEKEKDEQTKPHS